LRDLARPRVPLRALLRAPFLVFPAAFRRRALGCGRPPRRFAGAFDALGRDPAGFARPAGFVAPASTRAIASDTCSIGAMPSTDRSSPLPR
jgi:hypothetical protein